MYVVVVMSKYEGRLTFEVHGTFKSKKAAMKHSKVFEFPCLAFVEYLFSPN